MFRILVILRIPRQPARTRQLDLIEQLTFTERAGADNIDFLDLGDIPLVDRQIDPHTVAFQRCDRGFDRHTVQTFGKKLALQLLLSLIKHRAIKNPPFSHAGFLEGFLDRFLVERFQPGEIDRRNRRAFIHCDDQNVAFDFNPHVLEKPGGKQCLDRFSGFFLGEALAYLDRQIAEDGAGFGALDAFNPDVLDDERIKRPSRHCGGHQRGQKKGANARNAHAD